MRPRRWRGRWFKSSELFDDEAFSLFCIYNSAQYRPQTVTTGLRHNNGSHILLSASLLRIVGYLASNFI